MNSKAHILVVDDDDLLRDSIQARLEQDGFKVSIAATGSLALTSASQNHPDLVILDIGLADGDGLDICRALQRDHPAVRVIFLTGRSSEIDKVSGLALGDDYLTKPFSLIELEARIGSVLRRTWGSRQNQETSIIDMGEVRLDPISHEVKVYGQPVELTPKEFDLLYLLMSRAGDVLSSNEILSAVWGPEFLGAHDLVYVHVSWLRQKLGDNPRRPKFLHTVRSVGYRFLPKES